MRDRLRGAISMGTEPPIVGRISEVVKQLAREFYLKWGSADIRRRLVLVHRAVLTQS